MYINTHLYVSTQLYKSFYLYEKIAKSLNTDVFIVKIVHIENVYRLSAILAFY